MIKTLEELRTLSKIDFWIKREVYISTEYYSFTPSEYKKYKNEKNEKINNIFILIDFTVIDRFPKKYRQFYIEYPYYDSISRIKDRIKSLNRYRVAHLNV